MSSHSTVSIRRGFSSCKQNRAQAFNAVRLGNRRIAGTRNLKFCCAFNLSLSLLRRLSPRLACICKPFSGRTCALGFRRFGDANDVFKKSASLDLHPGFRDLYRIWVRIKFLNWKFLETVSISPAKCSVQDLIQVWLKFRNHQLKESWAANRLITNCVLLQSAIVLTTQCALPQS